MPIKSTSKKQDDDFSLISRKKLLALYAGLLRCRMLQDFVATNRRSSFASSAAAAVAACVDRRQRDAIAAHPRDFLPAFAAGKSHAAIFSSLRTPAPAQRVRFARQLRSAIAATRKYQRNGKHVAAIFRGTATNGEWNAMLRTAAADRLPILFFSHTGQPTASPHLPSIAVDRDDVVAIYRVVSEGTAHARRGNGPTLIECISWHLTEQSDAIAKMEAYLMQKGIPAGRRKTRVTAEMNLQLGRRERAPRKYSPTLQTSRQA